MNTYTYFFLFYIILIGPRICLGQEMATFEAKLCTAVLIKNFRFKLDEEYHFENQISYSLMITMSLATSKKGKEKDIQGRKHEIKMFAEPRKIK